MSTFRRTHQCTITSSSSFRKELLKADRSPYLGFAFCCCCCCWAEVVSLDTTRVSARFSARSRSFSVLYFCSSYDRMEDITRTRREVDWWVFGEYRWGRTASSSWTSKILVQVDIWYNMYCGEVQHLLYVGVKWQNDQSWKAFKPKKYLQVICVNFVLCVLGVEMNSKRSEWKRSLEHYL